MKILVGTNNAHKVMEIRRMLPEYEIVTPAELGIRADIVEDGASFEENARIKAEGFAGLAGLITFADDSGLQVDCLDGAPGIYSARYCPKPGATDADRRAYLLENIRKAGAPRPWTARFYCAIALICPDGRMFEVHGSCEGEIAEAEQGANGFGYDPIFYVPRFGKTLAEMAEDEKNAISHRGNAIAALRLILAALSESGQ